MLPVEIVIGVTVHTKNGIFIYPGNTVVQVDDGKGLLVLDLARARSGELVWLIGENLFGLVD